MQESLMDKEELTTRCHASPTYKAIKSQNFFFASLINLFEFCSIIIKTSFVTKRLSITPATRVGMAGSAVSTYICLAERHRFLLETDHQLNFDVPVPHFIL